MQTDDDLFTTFCDNRVTGAPHDACTRKTLLCRQMTSTQEQYQECTGQAVTTTSSTASTTPASTTMTPVPTGAAGVPTASILLFTLASLICLAGRY